MVSADTLHSAGRRQTSLPAASSQPTQRPDYPSLTALGRVTVLFIIYTGLLTLLGAYRLACWLTAVVRDHVR